MGHMTHGRSKGQRCSANPVTVLFHGEQMGGGANKQWSAFPINNKLGLTQKKTTN